MLQQPCEFADESPISELTGMVQHGILPRIRRLAVLERL